MKRHIQDRDEDYLEADGMRVPSGAKTGAFGVQNQLQTPTAPKCGEVTSATQMPEKKDVGQAQSIQDNYCTNGHGGTRTHTPVAERGILSPLRLPFRHMARVVDDYLRDFKDASKCPANIMEGETLAA